MIVNLSAAAKRFLSAFLLVVFFAAGSNAQLKFTRAEVARLDVGSRADLFENEILRAAKAHGVDPNILWTIAYLETRFRPWLRSPKNAQGMMQFIPSTAARFALRNPYDPAASIHAAARYVKFLSNSFGGRLDSILAAYNSGEGTVSAYLTGKSLQNGRKIINPSRRKTIGGIPPYAETVSYVGRGLKIYRWLVLQRRAFPAEFASAKFPTFVGAQVAGVKIQDYELSSRRTVIKTSQVNLTAIQDRESDSRKTEQTKKDNNSRIIYYDARSGSRYLIQNGKKEKLPENGELVINETIRPEATNNARSIFFANTSNK